MIKQSDADDLQGSEMSLGVSVLSYSPFIPRLVVVERPESDSTKVIERVEDITAAVEESAKMLLEDVGWIVKCARRRDGCWS